MRTSQQDNWVPRMGGELASSPDPHCIRSKRPPRHRWRGGACPGRTGWPWPGNGGFVLSRRLGGLGGASSLGAAHFHSRVCSYPNA